MARGFHFHLSTHGPDDLTVERAKETANGLGQRLSVVEHELLHVAVDAARAIVGALGHAASVEFHGVDSLTVPGDDTAVSVTVTSPATVTPDAAPVTEETAPTPEPPVVGPPAPVETTPENTEVANGETVVEPTQSPA